ncbi:hypothetical protein GCM10022419_087330 [Nonomuraea rosea]|uniref:Uncharacterized protein n=1 Tax=Nonomuraea rosea TaxID=638574 RepID=A0ABP6YXH4_9ACTN
MAGTSDEIDTTRPSIARAYDVVLRGNDNFEVDRAFVAEIAKVIPEIYDVATYNRLLLGRGVRFMLGQGITQFLDLGVSDRLIEPGNDQGIEPPVVTGPFGVDAEYLPL